MRLSVNVDHVATLREARGGIEPDPVHAAVIVKIAGADGVTVHLRKDRRHIKERDVEIIKKVVDIPLTVEMGLFDDIIDFVYAIKPDKITLVPEREGERTTEGGLSLKKTRNDIERFLEKMKDTGTKIGAFIEAEKEEIDLAREIGLKFVELNTTQYAKKYFDIREFEKILECAKYAKLQGLYVMAGHALNFQNVKEIAKIREIDELSIGHSIISRAIFRGLENAIKEILEIIKS